MSHSRSLAVLEVAERCCACWLWPKPAFEAFVLWTEITGHTGKAAAAAAASIATDIANTATATAASAASSEVSKVYSSSPWRFKGLGNPKPSPSDPASFRGSGGSS